MINIRIRIKRLTEELLYNLSVDNTPVLRNTE
jgi:hypothetical protein